MHKPKLPVTLIYRVHTGLPNLQTGTDSETVPMAVYLEIEHDHAHRFLQALSANPTPFERALAAAVRRALDAHQPPQRKEPVPCPTEST